MLKLPTLHISMLVFSWQIHWIQPGVGGVRERDRESSIAPEMISSEMKHRVDQTSALCSTGGILFWVAPYNLTLQYKSSASLPGTCSGSTEKYLEK